MRKDGGSTHVNLVFSLQMFFQGLAIHRVTHYGPSQAFVTIRAVCHVFFQFHVHIVWLGQVMLNGFGRAQKDSAILAKCHGVMVSTSINKEWMNELVGWYAYSSGWFRICFWWGYWNIIIIRLRNSGRKREFCADKNWDRNSSIIYFREQNRFRGRLKGRTRFSCSGVRSASHIHSTNGKSTVGEWCTDKDHYHVSEIF